MTGVTAAATAAHQADEDPTMGRHTTPDQPHRSNTTDPDQAEARPRSPLGTRVTKIVGAGLGVLMIAGCVNTLASGDSTTPQPAPVVAAAAPTTTAPAPTYRYAPPTTSTSYTSSFDTPEWGTNPERVTVTRVVDGDTFEVGDRKIRVLGIDSCENSTDGGQEAKQLAETLLDGEQVTLTSEPGVDTDRYDRELRYVHANGSDFGNFMVIYDHTAPYQGRNDASEAYMTALRDSELDDERDCSGTPTPSSSDVDIDVDRDGNMPDGALTGGYCARKWWC